MRTRTPATPTASTRTTATRLAAVVTAACRSIEAAERPPTLRTLALQAGLSPFQLHRAFKAITGLTPQAYAAALRSERLRQGLLRGDSVTGALHDAGYGSSARLYENAAGLLGMTPGRYRAGGAGIDIRFAIGECSLGSILVACSDRGICAILLGDDAETLLIDLQRRFPQARLHPGDACFESLVATVVGFVEQPRLGLQLPLDIRGTAFQQRVWQALRRIPAGSTVSYAELARRIGQPRAARAVAAACAANALAVAIPCHRVVRRDGELSGYRWGIERKRTLLERESADPRRPGGPA